MEFNTRESIVDAFVRLGIDDITDWSLKSVKQNLPTPSAQDFSVLPAAPNPTSDIFYMLINLNPNLPGDAHFKGVRFINSAGGEVGNLVSFDRLENGGLAVWLADLPQGIYRIEYDFTDYVGHGDVWITPNAENIRNELYQSLK